MSKQAVWSSSTGNRLFAVIAVAWMILIFSPMVTASEKGQKFDTGGVTIWYEIKGSGSETPLVIVNGGPGFDHSYVHLGDAVWDQLAQTRPVIFYDQRGNGQSSELKAGQSCTLADQIDDLDGLRRHLGVDKVDLLGHSWGGYLVMAYTARNRERVRRLIIVGSAAPKIGDTKFLFRDVFPETVAKQDALEFAGTLGDKVATSESMKLYTSMLFYSTVKRDSAMPVFDKVDVHQSINEAIWADLGRFDLNPELLKFDCPTLVITGRFDMNVAPSVAWKIHQAVKGSSFVIFEQSGHIPFYEEPVAFFTTLQGFLK